jgi:hypothetical protein
MTQDLIEGGLRARFGCASGVAGVTGVTVPRCGDIRRLGRWCG